MSHTSSVFISNKTDSGARKLLWSTTPASQHTGGEGPNGLRMKFFFVSFFSQASTIMAKAITMIQVREKARYSLGYCTRSITLSKKLNRFSSDS